MGLQRTPGINGRSARKVLARFSAARKLAGKLHPRFKLRWSIGISAHEWKLYSRAISALKNQGIPFMLGGGFALAIYTGRWRDTKDIDFYIMPEARDRVVDALAKAGFTDLFRKKPYDPKWIFRSIKSDVIVDVIWSMANQRAQVDPLWFERAGLVKLRHQQISIVPLEEFLWCKLYILQRDHCDWTDIFNLLYAAGPQIDWPHLIRRLGPDVPLLKALLTVYGWLCPRRARLLPASIWTRLGLHEPAPAPRSTSLKRIRYLDSRAWFAALQPRDKKLEI